MLRYDRNLIHLFFRYEEKTCDPAGLFFPRLSLKSPGFGYVVDACDLLFDKKNPLVELAVRNKYHHREPSPTQLLLAIVLEMQCSMSRAVLPYP